MLLRPARRADLPRIVELNDAASPAVPVTAPSDMEALLELSSLALVVVGPDDVVHGFVVAVDPGSDYASENYRFFEDRGTPHVYVDRIVVDGAARGSGVGRRLYDAVFDRARSTGRDEVTCEVNLEPPNPDSLAFHERLGFARVAEQSTKGGSVRVALLAARV
ncbi:GNAT family N-acetyltransferase [Lysobacter korlensis]|uniref:GNAT family N-acetyltransferase n=1 Tax=Lysobacter korlensis TaxID=553636 RepID=A0ABV6RNB1_9GAMM